jgi:hypothetical protein
MHPIQKIAEDRNGEPIYLGSKVKDSNGNIHEIIWDKHREKFDCGDVHGYWIPDYCEVIRDTNK